ncbi:hypothetical protein GWN42_31350 [candidate division KSB1 bacterium]|nr:hypothetical protein [Phycisphaerae bacterium]NIQ92556.1 hypothetical protein [Deltaproteobacteria bacterium]NIV97166.1 hypothetical protein [candidate division KSB1 bacterium]
MALVPSYQNVQIASHHRLDTANTALDGTGTLVTLLELPGSQYNKGALIEQVVLNRPSGTAGTALEVRLFVDDGVNIRYVDSLDLAADAQAQTIKIYDSATFVLSMEPGQTLKAAVTVSENVNVFVSGGVY